MFSFDVVCVCAKFILEISEILISLNAVSSFHFDMTYQIYVHLVDLLFPDLVLRSYLETIASSGFEQNPERQLILLNTASDIICTFRCAESETLSRWRARALDKIFERTMKENKLNPLTSELFGIMSKLCPTNYRWKTRLYGKAQEIIETNGDRNQRYVKLAALFKPLLDKLSQQERTQMIDDIGGLDLGRVNMHPADSEVEEAIRNAYREATNVDGVKKRLGTLQRAVEGRIELVDRALSSESRLLRSFFEEQARKVGLAVDFPAKPKLEKTSFMTRKWQLSDGTFEIDLSKTILRFGVNIPTVTTRTKRNPRRGGLNRIHPNYADLVVSIDCSQSTGTPAGSMTTAADYEVTMFYALVNLAIKVDQKIGLTLWNDKIEYTTLPQTLSSREAENLKIECLTRFNGDNTRISVALTQANHFRDKLFFLATDGQVTPTDLISVSNVFFFLINPGDRYYKMFVHAYGEMQVLKIENIECLPRLGLSRWMKSFWLRY